MKKDRKLCPYCLKSPWSHPCPSENGKKSGEKRKGDSSFGKKLAEKRWGKK